METKFQRIAVVSVGPGLWTDEVVIDRDVRQGSVVEIDCDSRNPMTAVVLSIKIRKIKVDALAEIPF